MQIISKTSLILILVVYIAAVAQTNFKTLSYLKDGRDFDRLGIDIVNTAPPGSIFFAGSDSANFSTLYQIYGQEIQTQAIFLQVNFIHKKYYVDQFKKKYPAIKFPNKISNQDGFAEFVALNSKRGVYLETPIQNGFWMPYGLLWKYYDTQEAGLEDIPNLVKENARLWNTVYHIPELTSNTQNIMHLQAIEELYLESYMTYAKLLFYAKENRMAQDVMKAIITKYSPSNNHAKVVLLNLFLLDNKCIAAKNVAKNVFSIPLNSLDAAYAVPLYTYYTQCESKNARIPLLKKMIEKNKEQSLTPLDQF